MISGLGLLLLAVICWFFMPTTAGRESVSYWKAKVTAEQAENNTRSVELLSGPKKGQTVTASVGAMISSLDMTPPSYKPGSIVFISHNLGDDGADYFFIIDYYRISAAVWLFVFIFAIAVIFAGWRGFGALAGLIFSIVVIGQFLIPNVINGNAPYLVTAVAIMVISLPGIYIAHGINKKTSLALVSTYLTLGLAVVLSVIAVSATKLSGISNEDTWLLSQFKPGLNIHGLLLCGLLISLVGILDDVTVGQAAAIEELRLANPKLSVRELYIRGLRIGREHIASLINTLVLVYVGASLLFIVYLAVVLPYPLLIVANSEFMMEEIVRSLVGSASLILAVPLTTLLAAYFLHPDRKIGRKKRVSVPSRRS